MSQNKKTDSYTYGVCHNIDGLNGFFTLSNREHLCQTLADAVALADRFNQVTGSTAYRATAQKNYADGNGYTASVVYKFIGVSPDGQPHENVSYFEHPVLWISEEQYDEMPEYGADGRLSLLNQHEAHYFRFTTARQIAYYKELDERLKAVNNNFNPEQA